MFPPDLESLLARIEFADQAAARLRLRELAGDDAELLALVRLSAELAGALAGAADPDAALRNLSRYVQARGSRLQLYHLLLDDPATLERLIRVIGASQYLADVVVRNPEYLDIIDDSLLLGATPSREDLAVELATTCAPFPSPTAQLDAVRRFRRRQILRIGAADLCGIFDFHQTVQQLSCVADAVVGQCLRIVGKGDTTGLIVLALGKLGGDELNYSSDIDLIFVAAKGDGLASATQLARALTHALSDFTGEGFLYRVDLRLRPYGASGPIVVSADMFAEYLDAGAHPAERQAMLKARPIAGDLVAGHALLKRLSPILLGNGPSARRQVRELKSRIERQLAERGQATDHLKLGPGGIRDVEFVVQALQLETGAAHPGTLSTSTISALERLQAAGLLAAADAHTLREAYILLRLIEHRLQLMDNQQVHRLPPEPGPLHLLARTLGIEGPDAADILRGVSREHTLRVRAIFDRLLAAPSVVGAAAPTQWVGVPSENLPPTSELLHPELLARVREPADVEVFARRESHQRWTVTVALWDRIGVLSILTGLFAAHRVEILTGEVRSLRPADRPRSAQALDTFVVDTPRWVDEVFWRDFRNELAELAALLAGGEPELARERIVDRVSQMAKRGHEPHAPLFPVSVSVDNAALPDTTVLSIRSTNTLGFLFEFTAALAVLNVNVQRVQICTVHHEVHDTFLVTDDRGRKILHADRLHELQVAAALIKHFTHLLPQSPDPAQALRQFSTLTRQTLSRGDWVADLQSLESDAVLRTLAQLMGVSQFLWEDFLREQHENLFPVLRNIPALDQAKSKDQLNTELSSRHTPCAVTPKETPVVRGSPDPAPDSVTRLNQFKDREMFRIDLRHITRRTDLEQFSGELTDLAEVIAEDACRLCHEQLQQRFGAPLLASGRPCSWCVCGLGKFGGRELGYASDIELIFVYQGEGRTSGPDAISNARYFEEFVSTFLRTLRGRREGIFEIDLRLRPHGKAGSLACSLAGFSHYFSEGGEARQFERLALVKLRPVAGDSALGDHVVRARDEFVYGSQPLDYDNILHLRHRQASELVPSRATSAKHSLGGLADLEYFVQARQIEFGSANPSMRVTSTLEAIGRLQAAGVLSADKAQQLAAAYQFLRRLIEALRVVRGHAKDLTIPPERSKEFAHLARRMQFESPAVLAHEINHHMTVAQHVWSHPGFGDKNPQ
jgi:[glutamine synthetase] adenylyltransferase / [glutamine synthetase]-adenylyl-L-tyrosine phosphorylase